MGVIWADRGAAGMIQAGVRSGRHYLGHQEGEQQTSSRLAEFFGGGLQSGPADCWKDPDRWRGGESTAGIMSAGGGAGGNRHDPGQQ